MPASTSDIAHAGRLSIDLGAIAANWRATAARHPRARAGANVKANAYGCGLERVVDALAAAGCRDFFVAHLSEALRARAVAAEAAIYVLNGLPENAIPRYRAARLIPVLGAREEIADWMAHGGGPSALHIDTGLNRLGLSPGDVPDIPEGYQPSLVMTHFVASEEPDAPINAAQIAAFNAATARFHGVPRSVSNSSGTFLPDDIEQDLLRPGYLLYGGNPTPGKPNPMREVVRLDAPIIQIRDVPAGASVGYNSQWTAPAPRRIATVSLGYADGYLRSGGGIGARRGGAALIGGVVCPVVGRVSMDTITLDVTGAPEARRGARALFIGDALDIDAVADRLGTNGYEILTRLGERLVRDYHGT